jgi:chemotaxis protein MotB
MARKKKHEEHVNAEAWAIPYGDLVTLLFALFTVMYAMSSVNEGKFRVLSDSMIAAFRGAPKSMRPINIGEKESGKGGDKQLSGITPTALLKLPTLPSNKPPDQNRDKASAAAKDAAGQIQGVLVRMEKEVQDAMQSLIDAKLVSVKRESMWLEVEINTDILFPSGSGAFSARALPVLDNLANVLKPFPNSIRVEGHTDDRPIRTASYPSNWELSAARAASVVHEFTKAGIDPLRLEIVGFGEYHPLQSNDSVAGRNANRRVAILILAQSAMGPGSSPNIPNTVAPTGAPAVAAPPGAAPDTAAISAAPAAAVSADPAVAQNRASVKVSIEAPDKTVLIKAKGKTDE